MSGERIAVVDDDDAMVETLCDVLELHGWSPVRAANGVDAVDLVTREQIDVVLMDIRMPVMNGVDALGEIRRRRPHARVVLFTASAAPDLLTRAETYGAAHVLKKPVDTRVLLSVLEGLRKAG
jgi:CheY-like chemotaxis protein